ncbi:sodium/hydrogen exchanger 6, partial [Tanacetum coccineum]
MHVQVNTWADHKTLFCSFVYADNYYINHRVLWSNLVGHAGLMRNRPWVLLGDFNAALNLEDHSAGGYEPNAAMREFKECVQAIEVADVNSTSLHFTWNQKPKGSNGILKNIDRIMGNLQFNGDFPRWNVNLEGCAMFHVVKRLKGLKSPFCKLLHNQGNLHDRVNKIRIELDEAQKAIDRDPSSPILHEEHAHYLLAFKEAQLDEEHFLKQKAKIKWLKAGDSNTTYFHKIMKSKCTRNMIEMVSDASNNLYDGNQVPGAFVNHYNQFLGAKGVTIPLDDQDLFTRVLDDAKANFIVHDVSNDKVKSVIFSMGNDRAPGPNGFTAAFFKKAWDVVGGDITCVIIANRVKDGLSDIVSINQSAFVHVRRISDNILLMQELMRNYHMRRGPPRCAFKFDIQKAYDTVDWSFLETILVGFGFHPKMVSEVCGRRIINLCFADDLFLFSCGNPSSVAVIMDALDEFKQVSGVLPVRYLGMPLISSRLLYRDCKILAEKVESRVNNWRNKFLSLAGQEMKKGKAKVAWKSVCMPKHEGGLCICRIDDFNVALMATHIWSILTHMESLWVKWVHTDIARLGFSLGESVNNLISDGVWRWPLDWLSRFPIMAQLQVPLLLDNIKDVILWRDRDGVLRPFSVACAWDTIQTRADIVDWNNVVWFPHCIPRHAIHMWLVFQQKLKTQDRLRQWDVGPSIELNLLRCPLCVFVPTFITPISKGKTAFSILSRLVFAATSYYIWLERNERL